MARVEIKSTIDVSQLDADTSQAVKDAVVDVTTDLLAVARGTAPHWQGDLEKGITDNYSFDDEMTGMIGVSAIGGNGYDYGLLRHDYPFELGVKSQAKGSGSSPMFGGSYPVGYEFVTRPADGLEDEYLKYIEEEFYKALGGE